MYKFHLQLSFQLAIIDMHYMQLGHIIEDFYIINYNYPQKNYNGLLNLKINYGFLMAKELHHKNGHRLVNNDVPKIMLSL